MKNIMMMMMMMILVLSGCGAEEAVFVCSPPPAGLDSAIVGDDITSSNLESTFSSVVASRYTSGSYCSDTYLFNQYNTDSVSWCYYYSIDVDCSTHQITSIYSN